jgi:hypothetical protein
VPNSLDSGLSLYLLTQALPFGTPENSVDILLTVQVSSPAFLPNSTFG